MPETTRVVPPARSGSHEDLLGEAFGNYVPTVLGRRYDALVWLRSTTALVPLHHEPPPVEPEYETAPSGY